MSLKERLDSDLKDAMRARDRLRSDTIRSVKATVTNTEVKQGDSMADAGVEEIVARLVRQHRESIDIYTKADRADLVEREETELEILLGYLPEQLSTEAIKELVQRLAKETGVTGPSDKGKLMGALIPQVKGKADGKVVNEVVTEILEGLAG
jgi:uncharacterized protein YqeY